MSHVLVQKGVFESIVHCSLTHWMTQTHEPHELHEMILCTDADTIHDIKKAKSRGDSINHECLNSKPTKYK